MKRVTRNRDLPVVWIRPAEAARMYGIGRNMIYKLVGSGELPSSKVGAARLIRCADIEALLERRQQG
jgi:excisionase family DNA binding protein